MRVALYQPDIPQNAGTILRTAACLGVPVAIIKPAGFDLGDRALRRAGLDYLPAAMIEPHTSFEAFEAWRATASPRQRLVLLSSRGTMNYTRFDFDADDILLLGRESAGVPDSVHDRADASVRVPMQPGMRSLNVAVATAMVLGEALRQTGRWPE